MIAVDSSALVAILRREPEADAFLQLIATTECVVSAVTLLETSMVLAGRTGDGSNWAELDALVARAEMEVAPFDAAQAEAARQAFVRYGKGRHPAGLNFGDCVSYALATLRGLSLLYKGNDFPRTDLASAG